MPAALICCAQFSRSSRIKTARTVPESYFHPVPSYRAAKIFCISGVPSQARHLRPDLCRRWDAADWRARTIPHHAAGREAWDAGFCDRGEIGAAIFDRLDRPPAMILTVARLRMPGGATQIRDHHGRLVRQRGGVRPESGSPVLQVHHLRTGALLEVLHGDMRVGTGAERAVVELAGLRLGQRNEIPTPISLATRTARPSPVSPGRA